MKAAGLRRIGTSVPYTFGEAVYSDQLYRMIDDVRINLGYVTPVGVYRLALAQDGEGAYVLALTAEVNDA